jgi:hypothetical protein
MDKKITKKCQCCGAGFASGKDYGDYWVEGFADNLPLGLCEFCNPNNPKWYINNKKCHYDETNR